MNILDLIGADTTLKRVSASKGGEFAGACPGCGGEDRFRVWSESGRFWCRRCGKKGDSIQYLRDFRNLSFKQAAQLVGKQLTAPRKDTPLLAAARARLALEDEYKDFAAKYAIAAARMSQVSMDPSLYSEEFRVEVLDSYLLILEYKQLLDGLKEEIETYCVQLT